MICILLRSPIFNYFCKSLDLGAFYDFYLTNDFAKLKADFLISREDINGC